MFKNPGSLRLRFDPTPATQIQILILRRPQEPDKNLGTARLAHLALPNSTLKIGLSWPNLAKALGKEAVTANWAVLYLGSGIKDPEKSGPAEKASLQFVSKKGEPVAAPKTKIDGIVVLDGTWSQAKALWWRNAWLLKLKRGVLQPSRASPFTVNCEKNPVESVSRLLSLLPKLWRLWENPLQRAMDCGLCSLNS